MATSKLARAQAQIKRLNQKAKEAESKAMRKVAVGVAAYAIGQAEGRGWLNRVPGESTQSEVATIGLIAFGAELAFSGRASEYAGAVSDASVAISSYLAGEEAGEDAREEAARGGAEAATSGLIPSSTAGSLASLRDTIMDAEDEIEDEIAGAYFP